MIKNAKLEMGLQKASKDLRYQFERLGYFCLDSQDATPSNLVFNRIVDL